MGSPQLLPENAKVVQAFQIQTGAAIAGDWVSMKNYHKCMIIVNEMRGADATGTEFRLDKAMTAAGGTPGTLTMQNYWSLEDIVAVAGDAGAGAILSDTMVKETAGVATFTGSLDATGVSCLYVFDVDAHELLDGYDYLQIQVVGSNANHYIGATYILYEPRFSQATTPTVIT